MAKSSASKAAPKKAATATTTNTTSDPALLDLFTDGIKDIYWAENHLVKALPKMQKAATGKKLTAAIAEHLEVTKTHVTRLEQVFELLGKKPKAKKCDAMDGITKEGEGIVEDTEAGTAARDYGIIMASQKAEHYEIATYGGLTKLAAMLGLDEVADILAQTLAEEKAADETLAGIAETGIDYSGTGA